MNRIYIESYYNDFNVDEKMGLINLDSVIEFVVLRKEKGPVNVVYAAFAFFDSAKLSESRVTPFFESHQEALEYLFERVLHIKPVKPAEHPYG